MKAALRHLSPSERIAATATNVTARRHVEPPAPRAPLTREDMLAQRRASRRRHRLLVSLARQFCAAMRRGLTERQAIKEAGCSLADAEAALDLPVRALRRPD